MDLSRRAPFACDHFWNACWIAAFLIMELLRAAMSDGRENAVADAENRVTIEGWALSVRPGLEDKWEYRDDEGWSAGREAILHAIRSTVRSYNDAVSIMPNSMRVAVDCVNFGRLRHLRSGCARSELRELKSVLRGFQIGMPYCKAETQ